MPEDFTIIVISRRGPLPIFSHGHTNNDIPFIGWDDIRLSLTETRDLALRSSVKGIAASTLERLHEKTDGWAAGLVLILESLKNSDIDTVLTGSTRESIFNYFASEIFIKMDETTQRFLMQTSLLPGISPAAAAELTGLSSAGALLDDLSKNNFFTTRHTHHDASYQFHPLFREFLMTRARDEFTQDGVAAIERRAAVILEKSGKVEDAIGLFLRARDWPEAARLISTGAPALLSEGRTRAVRAWLDAMPRELIEQTPYLLFWQGACLLAFNPRESRASFEKAFALFRRQGDRTGLFLSWCAVVDTAFHECVYVHMRPWTEILGRVLAEDPSFPSNDIEHRVALSYFNAVAFGQPDHPDIHEIRERAFSIVCAGMISDADLFLNSGLHLITHYIYQGNFTKAGMILSLLRESAKSGEATELVQLMVKAIEAHYSFVTCALDEGMKKAHEALALADKSGVHFWDTYIYGHMLAASLSEGDEKLIGEFLPKMTAGLGACRAVDKGYYYWLLAWKSALSAKYSEARQFLELSLNGAVKIGFRAAEAAIRINLAEICLEEGFDHDSAACLEKVFPLIQSMGSAYLLYSYSIAESCLHFKRENEVKGLESLRKAFSLGRDHGIDNMYFWRPSIMVRLCMKALESGIEVEYARHLISKRQLMPLTPPLHLDQWPWPVKIYTLGGFELLRDEKPVVFPGKVQQKPHLMLKILIAFGGKGVSESQFIDALWPEAEGDAAKRNLDITLHRLRKLLGDDEAIMQQEGQMSLNDQRIWTDAWGFERLLWWVEDMWKQKEQGHELVAAIDPACLEPASRRPEVDFEEKIRLTEKALALYKGHFLSGDTKEPWTISLRERLRAKFLYYTKALGNYRQQSGRYDLAVKCYQNGIGIDDLAEELYQQLMICHHKLGQEAEVVKVYYSCRTMLHKAFGLEPSTKTKEIYSSIRRNG